ncbi:MAG TPA: penicillin-binding transpeptidase domain-containing protein [Roseiflexaceae bacterium]|nr:penicillin-binding transpeptidase domain-containing protein [Roseiflexaceae bacterium]
MNRLLVPKLAVLLLLVVLVGRLYTLQLVDSEASRLRYSTGSVTTRYLPVRPLRGEIYASDGKTLLAESVPIYTVSIRPADVKQAIKEAKDRSQQVHDELYMRLDHILGITGTLTISPAVALEQNASLASDISQGLGAAAVATAKRQSAPRALQFTVPPAQSAAALTLTEQYTPVVQLAPTTPVEPATKPVTRTLVISPATSLDTDHALRDEVQRLLGSAAVATDTQAREQTWVSIDVPPDRSMAALKISTVYSNVLKLNSSIAQKVEQSNVPGYQTVSIKEDIPHTTALLLSENAASLPGVVVERDYRRRYPLSSSVESFSHLLGYTGRISECQLASRNPARSWSAGLLDSIGHAVQCGVLQKEVDPAYYGRYGMARYLNDDRLGKDGIEASYEDVLRGQLGIESIIVDSLGNPVSAPQTLQPAQDGHNLELTIDVPFQQQVEQVLRNWIAEGERRRQAQTGAFAYKRDYAPITSGAAVVTEVKTGRILAMVSWPSYDNNIWVDPARRDELAAFYPPESEPEKRKEMERLAPLTNRSIAGQYPPGSTLKQFDASVALQDGEITPDTTVRDPSRLVLEDQYASGVRYVYPNSTTRDNGFISVSEALMRSSNVFFMSVMGGNKDHVVNIPPQEQNLDGLGISKFSEGLGWFGFGKLTGIKMAGEEKGRVPTPAWKQEALRSAWTTGDTYNMAIGQGNMLVTPLQLVMGGAAIANNGTLFQPHIVKAITDQQGKVVQEVQPQVSARLPVDPNYLAVVREGMRRSVTEGVNIAARDDCSGLQIAGKTGTAEFGPVINIPDGRGGTRQTRQSHSWFVGFAPYNDPQIEVVALVEGTGDLGDGSATIAVPAVTQMMQAYFNVTPPNPLPRTCQQNLPPLPARQPVPGTTTAPAATEAPTAIAPAATLPTSKPAP